MTDRSRSHLRWHSKLRELRDENLELKLANIDLEFKLSWSRRNEEMERTDNEELRRKLKELRTEYEELLRKHHKR